LSVNYDPQKEQKYLDIKERLAAAQRAAQELEKPKVVADDIIRQICPMIKPVSDE